MSKSYTNRALYIRQRNGDNNTWSNWILLIDESDLAWSNVSGRPTKVSQFTNDSGYITSSASISGNAGSATKLQTTHAIWT